jgi:sugar phosphate isomerase/epimerase
MFLGYNTNGFAHHRLEDAISVLADLGYRGVALTPDVHHLDPFAPELAARTAAVCKQLAKHQMACVIETGARFLLDPLRKHQPTLLSPDPLGRTVRMDFLKTCVNVAGDLNARCVSFWSGATSEMIPDAELMQRLTEGCQQLADHAASKGVALAFEPEPGMFIDTMEKFSRLHEAVNHPAFGLTVDVGHLVCNGELPVSRVLTEWKHTLWNIHIEDMRRGVHDHVMFGDGEVDFDDVFTGLEAAGYCDGVFVELSRHSFDAVQTARKARTFLQRFYK